MKTCVLFNPKAGSAGQIDALREALAKVPGVTLRELGPDDDLGRLAADAARGGFDVVAVAGGDGTVHRAVNGLGPDFPPVTLAVFPLGTGNDLARTLAVPLDAVESVGLLTAPDPRPLDVVRVSGAPNPFLVNVATGGFSGQVAAEVTPELKATWGPLAYLRGAAGPIGDPPTFRLTLRFDGGPPRTVDAVNLVVANARTAAGGLPVAPTADPEDGKLDVVVVKAGGGPLDLSVVAARLMAGDYLSDEHVVHWLASKVEVESDPPIPLSVDGELTEGSRFAFEVVPKALRVLVGPGYHPTPDAEPPVDSDRDPPPARVDVGVRARLFGFLAGLLLLAKRAPRAYTVGLALLAVGSVGFVATARAVKGGWLAAWDRTVQLDLHERAPGWVNGVAAGVTVFGNPVPSHALALAAVAVMLTRRKYANAATLAAVIVGLDLLEVTLKPLFGIARPDLFRLTEAGGYSFPSGHALRGVGLYGALACLLAAGRGPAVARWAGAVLLVVLGVAVGWSRILLGVHSPSDVIAGQLAATAWVAACFVARRYAIRRHEKRRPPAAAGGR